jgi:hypothetical protein
VVVGESGKALQEKLLLLREKVAPQKSNDPKLENDQRTQEITHETMLSSGGAR